MDSGHNCKKRKSDDIERGSAAADRLDSKKRKKEKAIDRLSSLPDDLIHNILSFVSIQDAVKTMVLSSRYRFIWTTMPCLTFSTEDFPTCRLDFSNKKFSKFVSSYLKRRDSDVSSLKLSFSEQFSQPSFIKLMDYAFSHHIQRLDVECLFEDDIEFPLSMFGSLSLKHLSLKNGSKTSSPNWRFHRFRKASDRSGTWRFNLNATSTMEFPALTSLYLHDVTFYSDDKCVDLLSGCPNLKNLTLENCETEGLSSFSICHPGLSNLTLDTGLDNVTVVNVAAPQLENLTIGCNNDREHLISAPDLSSLVYEGYFPLRLSTEGFHCLKEANIWVIRPSVANAPQMVCLLQQLHNVKFLTLNLETIEVLSSSVEVISHQPSPFVNLKSLTIYPRTVSSYLPSGKVNLSTELKNYLLESSPGATFTMFSREEIRAMKDAKLAQKLMTSLQRLLKQEEAATEIMENCHEENREDGQKKMTHINSYWEDMSVEIEKGKEKTRDIVSSLHKLKNAMIKLPTSKRAEMQACFSSLCAEANIVMNKIIDHVNLRCNMKHHHFSACFQESTLKLQQSCS